MVVLRLVFFVFVASVSATTVTFAQIDDLLDHSNRYMRENQENDALTHWPANPIVSIIGSVEPDEKIDAFSIVAEYARASNTTVSIADGVRTWLDDPINISPDTTYLLAFMPTQAGSRSDPTSYAFPENVRNQVGLDLFELAGRAVPRISNGCFGSWLANSANEVSAFVGVIDSSTDAESAFWCIDQLVAASFGVSSYATTYTFGGNASVPLLDKSETYLLLRVSAYCRDVLKDNTQMCAASVIRAIHKNHSSLVAD